MKILILAGGGGTRLWPLSRKDTPKQFHSFFNHQSLLQETAKRASKLTSWRDIYLVAPENYQKQIQKQLPRLPRKNIILEPVSRNTAPCIGLAAVELSKKTSRDVLVVLPSDHFIQNKVQFFQAIRRGVKLAQKGEQIITLGIKPTYPETGYGYIRKGKKFKSGSYLVKKFLEKPISAVAKRFVNQGDYFWNSGMFIFRLDLILDAYEALMPETYRALFETQLALKKGQIKKAQKTFLRCRKISFDHGILEHFPAILILPVEFGWSDLGSFEALQKILPADKQGNSLINQLVLVESKNCLVKKGNSKLIGLVGLNQIGIIETKDVLLVCDLNQSQKIKLLLEKLKRNPKLKRFL